MKTRKILALVLSLVMLLSICGTALAVYTDAELEAFGLGGYTPNEVANDKISREIALDSYVLMENNGVLPIEKGIKVALFGSGATGTVKGGTGSGIVNQRERDWIDEALEDAGFTITTPQAYRDAVGRGVVATGFSGSRMANDVNLTDAWLEEAKAADTAIYVIGRNAGEGSDRQLASGDGAFNLTAIERANIEKVAANFENVIMVYNTQITDVSWMKEVDNIDALLHIGYGGQRTGATTVQILTGEVSPSGKTTSTWAYDIYDYASSQAGFSWMNNNTTTEYYTDGIYVGYRYFDTFGLVDEVAYPFGYGLSYTEFDINVVSVAADKDNVTVKVDVTNVGDTYSGKEVVQIYFSAPDGELEKPYQELAAFAKTDVLAPGEKQTLTISFATTDMSSYSEDRAAYIMDAGDYIIRVGNSSRNTEVAAVITLNELAITEQLSNQVVMEKAAELNEISKAGKTPITYAGEAEEIAAAKANAIILEEVAFLGNNASEYDDETITTYLFAADAENYKAREGIVIRSKSVAGILDNNNGRNGYMETRYDEVVEIVPDLPAGMTADTVKLTDVIEGKITLKQFVASLTEWELARLAQGAGGTSGVGYIRDDAGNVVSSSRALPGNVGRTTHELYATRYIPVLGYCDGPAGIRCDQDGVVSPQINQNNRVGGTYFYSSDGGITVDRGSGSSVQLNQTFNVEGSGRYVKLNLTEPGTQYGFSIYEWTINALVDSGMDNVALNKPVTVKSEAVSDGNLAYEINDGNTSSRWGSDYRNGDLDNSWVIIDLGEVYDLRSMGINFEAAYAGAYTVQVSNDGETYTTIYNSKDAPEQEDTRVRYWVLPTAFPSSSNLACTWNVDSMYAFGYGLGAEQAEYCVGAWLAPGMNIVRHPLCGRNFEYYSEDPLVTGMAAANVTAGVQTHKGGGVTIKHYWGNNQENNRNAENNVISERAAREIYLKGYEICIKLAQPMFMMTCYNENNGWPGGDSFDSCTDLARGEWGFNGLIMTDWNGGQSSPHVSMHAGNDMITPGKNVTTITNYLGITEPTINPVNGTISNAGTFTAAKGGTATEPVEITGEVADSVIAAAQAGQASISITPDGTTVTWYGDHIGRIVRGDVQKSALNILGTFLYSQDMQHLCEDIGVDYANSPYAANFSVAHNAPMANGWTNVEKSEVVNTTVYVGSANVDLSVDNTAAIDVTYNGDEAITAVTFKVDSELPIASVVSEYEVEYNEVDGSILVWDVNGIEGVLCTINYVIDAADGTYAIDVEAIDAANGDAETTSLLIVDGAIVVDTTYAAGDVTLDGDITVEDVVELARYLVNKVELGEKALVAADFDGNGLINNADLIKIARSILAA